MTPSSSAPLVTGLSGADQAAIAAVPGRLVKAWAAQDAQAFADIFVDNGSMLLPGVYRQGKDNIRDFMSTAFGGPFKGTRVTGTPVEIKQLAPGAVALITEGGVIPAGETTLPDRAAIRASWILVNHDGEWLLSVYQNCPRDRVA
ncbi:SgcJ/EcaC family oxidoreductase [Micromonospora sp. NPDC005710]|uniref:SgcJ/EcaC family oxidoreductase n=1 Tax=Micromonospora sp. NPDC005710 TaxID=3157051 RepID=UPI0033DA956E